MLQALTHRGEIAAEDLNLTGVAPVLLIESEDSILELLSSALDRAGIPARACASLAEARVACSHEQFALVIVDWVVEGFFADENLRSLQRILHPDALPPVLVLSRLGEAETREFLRPDSPIQGVLTRPSRSRDFPGWAPEFAASLKRLLMWMRPETRPAKQAPSA
jgi:CheY-like chemotaxis protein